MELFLIYILKGYSHCSSKNLGKVLVSKFIFQIGTKLVNMYSWNFKTIFFQLNHFIRLTRLGNDDPSENITCKLLIVDPHLPFYFMSMKYDMIKDISGHLFQVSMSLWILRQINLSFMIISVNLIFRCEIGSLKTGTNFCI